MESIELELRIVGLSGRRYRAVVDKSAFGKGASHLFELPEDSPLLSDGSLTGWRTLRRRSKPRDKTMLRALIERGKDLFGRVFEGEVYLAFRRSLELAQQNGHWFRLQLSFEAAPDAAEWPWEALVGPGDQTLALHQRVSIERRPRLPPGRVVLPPKVSAKPRILAAGASPADLTPIDVDAELKWLRGAWGKKASLKSIKAASRLDLDKALAENPGYDLIHLFGHGDFEDQEGGIWLQGPSGQSVRLSSKELLTYLRVPPPFVFLNVCHGGRSAADPTAGLAEALLGAGVGAVVAMQREITDPGAVTLAKGFYQRLAAGRTLVEAMAAARNMERDDCDWAVPILYLAGDDFALLPPKEDKPESLEAPTPAPEPKPWLPALAAMPWRRRAALAAGLLVLTGAMFWSKASLKIPPIDENSRKRCPSPPGLDLQLLYVKGGTFLQGSDSGVDTQPSHKVTLTEDFCLGRFELTRDIYSDVMGKEPPPPSEARFPMASLLPDEVQEFLRKLNERDPAGAYRLPTEAQWEYAARAGTTTTFYFGDDVKELSRHGNCYNSDATASDGFDGPAPVGSFEANPWGFYDLYGNVWELVADRWDPRKPVRRGGAFDAAVVYCSSVARKEMTEDKQRTIGFRIARTPVR